MPQSPTEISNSSLKMRSLHTALKGCASRKHVVFVLSPFIKDTNEVMTIQVPSGPSSRTDFYCLLGRFIPDTGAESKEIRALLKKKYPEQYAQRIGLDESEARLPGSSV
jgi:hypothetical protein